MKSAEQQIREMLGRAGVENPETYSAGNLVELANLIAEIAKQRVMRKQLEDWNKELVEALEDASKEFKKLPKSLGYDITHCKRYDKLIAKHTKV